MSVSITKVNNLFENFSWFILSTEEGTKINLGLLLFVVVMLIGVFAFGSLLLYQLDVKWFRPIACKFWKWHSHKHDIVYEQQVCKNNELSSCHYKCQWCGYEGIVDTYGNLF